MPYIPTMPPLSKESNKSCRGTPISEIPVLAVPAVPAKPTLPSGAVLLAPRYDGYGRPLKAVPQCWCCRTPWELERVQEWKGETLAWLKPGCGCLDAPQALACCGLCVEHCCCRGPRR